MTTPTPPLSTAAQNVRDAYKSSGLGAALIAAAEQVFPLMRMPDPEECDCSWDYDYLSIVFCEQAEGKNKLLALAAELRQEGQP
jgi:hypothetical protein